jgi:spore germination protein YaaH
VAAFQADYGVPTTTPGVYDAATQAALQTVIGPGQLNLGDTESWDENSPAAGSLLNLAGTYGLAGVSIWRLGYQTRNFWTTLTESGE